MLDDTGKAFWLTAGWSVIGCSAAGALVSLYFEDHGLAMFLGFVGVAAGGYLVQLGKYSKPQDEPPSDSTGL